MPVEPALAGPVVAGVVDESTAWHAERRAVRGFLSEPTVALPIITAISEICMGGQTDLRAGIVGASKAALAFPFAAGCTQVGVLRNNDENTVAGVLQISPLAFPTRAVTRIGRIGVRWNCDPAARVAIDAIASIAFPAAALSRLGCERVCRNDNGGAGCFRAPITALACPRGSECREIAVRRYVDGDAVLTCFAETSIAFPSAAVALRTCVVWNGSYEVLRLNCRAAQSERQAERGESARK